MSFSNLSSSVRCQIVVDAATGKKVTAIAREFKCTSRTIYRLIQQYRTTHSIETIKPPGPPFLLDETQLQTLRNIIRTNRYAVSAYLITLFYRATGITIGASTIRRYRRSISFTPRNPHTKLMMTPQQRRARHRYAVEHRKDDIKKWIFEDETTVYIQKTGDVIWVEKGEETPPTYISDVNASVRIWGIIRWTGKTFGIVEGTENQSVYIRWLSTHFGNQTHLLRDYMFIHDHCSWHQTQRVKDWIEDHGMEMVLNPVRTPEFNAIEYVWAWIKHDIATQHPTDQASLEAAVQTSFRAVNQDIIKHDIQHVQHLMQAEAAK